VRNKSWLNVFFLGVFISYSSIIVLANGNASIDSLEKRLKQNISDSEKISLYNQLSSHYLRIDTLKSYDYAIKAIKIAEISKDDKGYLVSNESLARYFTEQGRYSQAKSLLLALADQYGLSIYKKEVAAVYISLGNVYDITSDFENALKYYLKAEKEYNELNEERGAGLAQMGIANVYNTTNFHQDAKGYYRKSYKNLIATDEQYASWSLNNMAISMMELGENDSALYYFEISLNIKLKLNDSYGASYTYTDLGTLYAKLNNSVKAIENYKKALDIKKGLEGINPETIGSTHNKIGAEYLKLGDVQNGKLHLEEGVYYSKKSGSLQYLTESYHYLSKAYYQEGNYKMAYDFIEKYSQLSDSLNAMRNSETLSELQIKYETEQKEKDIMLLNNSVQLQKNELELKQLQTDDANRKTQLMSFLLLGSVLFIILISGLGITLYKSNKNKKAVNSILEKTNTEIRQQKHIIEEKQKEILDSIIYAKRIQDAILPSNKVIKAQLPNGFILFKPKDVVSGDFYWLEKVSDSIYFAAADCTGHGVPGAMVSVICSNALSKALLEEGCRETNQLLDRTRELVVKRFAKNGEIVKDGMDISLCKLTANKLQWSGANNPIWVVKSKEGEQELVEIKPDKQPVGLHTEEKPFTAHTLDLNAGDTIYIFTDGFADQFGGEKGKKFMYKPFKQLLLNCQHLTMDEQYTRIEKAFDEWKGENEQVDDVCIIGVRI
jgi:serine phosphatase RsbU (regulator of sigma subunit)